MGHLYLRTKHVFSIFAGLRLENHMMTLNISKKED